MITHKEIDKEHRQAIYGGSVEIRTVLRRMLFLIALLLFLLLADFICYQQALPIEVDVQGNNAVLHVGSESAPLGTIETLQSLRFEPHDPVVHEYQLDGTDSTNNFTLDTNYLHSIASSPYYRFQSWIRDLDGTSHWSDLHVLLDGRVLADVNWPENGSQVDLPNRSVQSSLSIQFQLRRPETPMSFDLVLSDNHWIQVTLDRNDRKIAITSYIQGQNVGSRSNFFPVDVLPFAAMVLDTLLRTAICAILVLFFVLLCEMAAVAVGVIWDGPVSSEDRSNEEVSTGQIDTNGPVAPSSQKVMDGEVTNGEQPPSEDIEHSTPQQEVPRAEVDTETTTAAQTSASIEVPTRNVFIRAWQGLTTALHPVALLMLVGSFCFVVWIAVVQYQGEPHIYDASAYLFAAKMYATGHLSVPVPAVLDRFPGPFMIPFSGQWFGQYAPGTALTLVPGIWLGVPWLVEPILGTFALLGIGLLAARLFDRRVATLAVVLGSLSPFYSYLAASYLSHAIALFYLVWGLWALLRFAQGEAGWNLPLAALLFGMGGLTRDLVAILFVITVLPGIVLLSWKDVRANWQRWIRPGVSFLLVAGIFVCISLGFNAALTHSPWVTPRSLFFQGDRWGFGQGIGFYGQHTVAAGLVNIDELLTILQIDLFGWPFYFTLAFLALPFLTWRARGADWFCLVSAAILIGAYVGYFYHGIYLGPRYVFESLPFLLILTARGIVTLAEAGGEAALALHHFWHKMGNNLQKKAPLSLTTIILVAFLVLFNLLYFLPRQIEVYQNYSGLPTWYHINLAQVYHPPFHNAVVVTSDYTIYQMVLFALNDPYLHGDVIYAWGSSAADYVELERAFPGRKLYQMNVAPDGSVQYVLLTLR